MGCLNHFFSIAKWYLCDPILVARPYGDPLESVTAPVPARSRSSPSTQRSSSGAVAPATPDPIPIVLLPGFEYRQRDRRHPDTQEAHWLLERRSAQQGDADE